MSTITMRNTARSTIERTTVWAALCCLVLGYAGPARGAGVETPQTGARPAPTAEVMDALPMAFEPNVGQTDARVRYVARGNGYAVFLTDDAATLALSGAAVSREALRLRLEGIRDGARPVAEHTLAGRSNYLVGDPETWRPGVETYAAVRYTGVYDGVDAVFYGTQKRLEYDFEVAPGADASQIRVRFEGQLGAEVAENGDLVLRLAGGEVRQQRAVVYQRGETGKQRVEASYEMGPDGEVRFALGAYDTARPLVIDPVIVYSAFLGNGTSSEIATSVAADSAGNVYVTGYTTATNYPTTAGAFDTTVSGYPNSSLPYVDAFVTKLAPGGASLVYSTYLGGQGDEHANAIAVDAAGAAYVTGYTESPDFPTTPGAFDTTYGVPGPLGNGNDAFVAKLAANGTSLVYSTFLGGVGNEFGNGIAIAPNGNVVVVGATFSNNFSATAGALDTSFNGGDSDAFVTRLNAAGNGLVYSTYLGGSVVDEARSVAVDATGNAYVTGTSNSSNFPTTPGAFDTTVTLSPPDAFVTKVNAAGTSLLYSTLLGTANYDIAYDIGIDGSGNAIVVGYTDSPDFPTTPGAFSTGSPGSSGNGFVTKMNATGTALVYSASFGSSAIDRFLSVVVDAAGNAYVAGESDGIFPTTAGAFDTTRNGDRDAVAFRLNAAGSALDFSTYLGGNDSEQANGIAVDGSGRAYVVGATQSLDFPGTAGAFAPTFKGFSDAYVTRIDAGGALGYSTMLSGTASRSPSTDAAQAIAVDPSGAIYVAGWTRSLTFPTTPGAYDHDFGADDDFETEAFVSKIAPGGGSLVFSTLLGGLRDEYGYGVAAGPNGEVYLTGTTSSSDFPTTPGAFDRTFAGSSTSDRTDAFVTRLAPDGGSLVYSTYLGALGDDYALGLALGSDGTAYVAGYTLAPEFPTTPGAFDTTFGQYNNADGFLTRVSADGASLVYSTFLGDAATDYATAIALDATGAAYVTGETRSPNFPLTSGAFDTEFGGFANEVSEAFVTKVSPDGASLVYSSFLGGDRYDGGAGIAIDGSGAAYVTGFTSSPLFPVTPGAYDTTVGADAFVEYDAFVTKVDPSGTSLVYSTFLGSDHNDQGYAITVGQGNVAYVTGLTSSSTFPTTADALDSTLDSPIANPLGSGTDAFLSAIAADGSALVYSSFLGGDGYDYGRAAATAPDGDILIAGESRSNDFAPTGFGAHDSANAFVTKFRFGGVAGLDTVGVHAASSSAFFLRNANSPGPADTLVAYGPAGSGWKPLSGDWDGDGDDTLGLYDPNMGVFFLRNSNTPGGADVVFSFGPGGAGIVPVVGDFDGDGDTTVGIYNSATGAFFLKNTNAGGAADLVFSFGPGGAGIVPVTGDFDGDGDDTVGIYTSTTGAFFLKNTNAGGAADVVFSFGPGGAGVVPLFGDYDGDGDDTVGIYSSASGAFFLKNTNAGGAADLVFAYGPGSVTPLVGDWDGL